MNPIARMMKRYIKMPLKYALPLLFIGALVLSATTGCTTTTNPTATPTAQKATVSPSATKATASPTAQVTPTAASTAAKGTASNSKISVAASNRGAYVSDNQFIQPKAGNKYVQIYATVTNVNYPGKAIANPFYFTLFDSKNEGHDPATPTFGEGGLQSIDSSNPGQKTAGLLIFEIAQDANPVYLTYDDFQNNLRIDL